MELYASFNESEQQFSATFEIGDGMFSCTFGENMTLMGPEGKSAYEVAVANGYSGSETDWLLSLKGDKGDPGYSPVRGKDYWTESDKNEIVSDVIANLPQDPGNGNVNLQVDKTLIFRDGVLSVNTTNDLGQDNTLPITSAGVYATVGNIEALLKTI